MNTYTYKTGESYTCPVCRYSNLEFPPEDFNICPCCGTEFGNDDFDMTHEQLLAEWVKSGCIWWSKYEEPPEGWESPIKSILIW